MGASVMTEVLRNTAVQIRDGMNEYDGLRKEDPASARDTWRHAAWMGAHTGRSGRLGKLLFGWSAVCADLSRASQDQRRSLAPS